MTRSRDGSRLMGQVRDYVSGVSGADVRRLFNRDAQLAYRVLTKGQPEPSRRRGRVGTLLHDARVLFLGMSYKLTPARRVLFAAAMVAALLALMRTGIVIDTERISVDFSPLWLLVSVALLVFLLALELVDRVLVRDELEVARQLQSDLLPRTMPEVPGYRFAHSYRTANEVGGDYYAALPLPDGRLALAIGDASGHGMAAGLLMAIANAVLQLAIDLDPSPDKVTAVLNRTLVRTGDRKAFMTLFYAVLDPATGRLDYVCSGHPFPLLRRPSGEIVELGTGGFPLGLRADLSIEPRTVTVEPGATLVLYTDGLPEAVDGLGVAFGYDRVEALLHAGGTPEAVAGRLSASLRAHLGEEPPQDDVSLLVIARD